MGVDTHVQVQIQEADLETNTHPKPQTLIPWGQMTSSLRRVKVRHLDEDQVRRTPCHLGHCLNSLKRGSIGDSIGDHYRAC